MRYLLDTNVLLWYINGDDRLIYAQSVIENIEFVYTDAVFDKYKNS